MLRFDTLFVNTPTVKHTLKADSPYVPLLSILYVLSTVKQANNRFYDFHIKKRIETFNKDVDGSKPYYFKDIIHKRCSQTNKKRTSFNYSSAIKNIYHYLNNPDKVIYYPIYKWYLDRGLKAKDFLLNSRNITYCYRVVNKQIFDTFVNRDLTYLYLGLDYLTMFFPINRALKKCKFLIMPVILKEDVQAFLDTIVNKSNLVEANSYIKFLINEPYLGMIYTAGNLKKTVDFALTHILDEDYTIIFVDDINSIIFGSRNLKEMSDLQKFMTHKFKAILHKYVNINNIT